MFLSAASIGQVEANLLFSRDYKSGVIPSQGQLEITLDALLLNDTVDLLNLRESRMTSVSSRYAGDGLGDLNGGRVIAAYGLTDNWMLRGQYQRRDLDITLNEFTINSLQFDLTRRFGLGREAVEWAAYGFVAAGVRLDLCSDYLTSDIEAINDLAQRYSSHYSISREGGRVVFSDGDFTLSSPIVDESGALKRPLKAGLKNSYDTGWFARAGLGRRWERLNVAIWAELGINRIEGDLEQNFTLYGIEADNPLIRDFTRGLDRDEHYAEAGLDLYYETLFGVAGHLAYSHLWLNRSADLDRYGTNQTLAAELLFRVTPRITLNLGATYYTHQFNGVIPLLYNRFTESSFDHDYGLVHGGVTVSLDL